MRSTRAFGRVFVAAWFGLAAALFGCDSPDASGSGQTTEEAERDWAGCSGHSLDAGAVEDAGGEASAIFPPIVVDTANSERGPVHGQCSLFMAVAALRNQADYGGCTNASGATTISLPAGIFDVSSGLMLSAPTGRAFSVVGHGVDRTILDTNGSVSPAIELDGVKITVSQLTLRATRPKAPTTGIHLDKSAEVTLDHVRVTGFTRSGVWNTDATLIFNACTVDGNSNPQFGGGLYQTAQDATATPTTFVNYSTISGNRASLGGGIYNLGYVNLMYSTIAGNTATGGKGGGIYLGQDYLETAHCTIAFNSATASGLGGGIYIDPAIAINVHVNSSIVANNTASSKAPDYSGLLRDPLTRIYDRDILGSAAGVTGGRGMVDIIGDPMLSGLANHGGPTETCAVLTKSSPAVDASRDFSATSTRDQRFRCTPYGPAYDVGAFEWRPGPTPARRSILMVAAAFVLAAAILGLAAKFRRPHLANR
ncbi:MAG: right-handed parallel beta-helix repeat-containing protein [Polyangiaceae bacterium]|jgi:hypothetical protein